MHSRKIKKLLQSMDMFTSYVYIIWSYVYITCLHHMVILKSQNKITDFFMILAWASPFKAGIANAISSFKWRKIFMKNKHVWKLTFWLTEHLSQTILWISVAFYFLWNLQKPDIYGSSSTTVNIPGYFPKSKHFHSPGDGKCGSNSHLEVNENEWTVGC